jgi:hypothetical protein
MKKTSAIALRRCAPSHWVLARYLLCWSRAFFWPNGIASDPRFDEPISYDHGVHAPRCRVSNPAAHRVATNIAKRPAALGWFEEEKSPWAA